MAYTTIDDPTIYFTSFLWTGNDASSRSFTGVGFQANMMWSKNRSSGHQHNLVDTVRGVDSRLLMPSDGDDEDTTCTHGHFDSLDSDGFTVTNAGGGYNVNRNANNFVGWLWKAGTSFTNDASSTSVGTIDSAGSFNNTPGFSIVSYTGTGSNGTIKHGLNTAPQVVWAKSRTHATNWMLGFNINSSINFTDAFALNQNYAIEDYDGYWNDTAPTSSVVSLGAHQNTNKSGENYIAYCFSEKQGYSKFGSYTGNGDADGTFVYTGFKPAFIIAKRTDGAVDWVMYDNKRDGFNPQNDRLYPNLSAAEEGTTDKMFDMLSNGFKARANWNNINTSGGTYIFMAFAESPFVSSSGVPTTAR